MFSVYERLVRAIARRPIAFLLLFAVVSVGLFFGASHVRLDGDLARLLPDSSPTVIGLRKLERVYGDEIGRITVVLSGPDAQRNRDAADALTVDLAALEGVDRIEDKDPRADLRPLRLLYMDTEDLRVIDERLSKRIRWEKQHANPLFADLGNRPRPEVDLSDIEAKYEGRTGERTYYVGPKGEVLVFVHPNFPASKLDESRRLVSAVEAQVQKTLAKHEGVQGALTGRYVKRIEQQDILTSDITRATPLALLLLALFLVAYFRSIVSAVYVVVPLAIGTAAGLTFAMLVFGNLNILTGFLGAILMGLGVDYGIHLISRYLEVRRSVADPATAWLTGFQTAGRASIYAAATTMIALGSLAVSTFRAFFEFGVIAMGGIFLILLTYALVLPALLFLSPNRNLRPSLAGVFGTFLANRLKAFPAQERPLHLKAMIAASAVVLVLAGTLGAWGLPDVRFDRTFASLAMTEGQTWQLDQMVNEILGESQTPAVVMVDNDAHMRAVVGELKRRQGEPGGNAIGGVLSLQDVIPADQPAKLEILQGLRDRIENVPASARSEQLKDFLAEMQTVTEHGALTKANLPKNIYVPFSRRDDPNAGIVLVMPGST
ncbi:MAG: MMPL family transporter [bacterium]